ncbi:MAG TPA: MEDS domain-containing protein [Actinophytocola sp.]|nr:MEDS domain-containing protein [Actinophytocola sp.]
MRSSGLVEDARGLGAHDHLCWRYDEPAELSARVREFLGEGLAMGARVRYVGLAPVQTLAGELHELDGMGEALDRGAAEVSSLTGTYSTGTVVEPAAQVRIYAAATAAALAAGYTGMRVAAEATPLVRTPAQLDAFARYEHLVDRYMARHPFSAMCAYRTGELGDDVIEQLACLHPNTNHDAAGFRLHASAGGEYDASMNGDLDLSNADQFATALDRAELPLRGDELVVDARGLTFIDHRGLLRLREYARRRGVGLVLHVSRPGPARIAEVLGLTDVRVEHRPEHAA